MKTTLAATAFLLAAACGDNLHPEDSHDQTASGAEDHDDGEEAAAGDFFASPLIYFPSCDEPLAAFEADGRRLVDNMLEIIDNFSCVWHFDDGTTFEGCVGEHVFAEGGFHEFTVEVTDLDTGAVRTATQNRFVYPPIEATLEVTTGDLSITYLAVSNRGNERHVIIEPHDQLILDDPDYHHKLENTVRVTEPGVYRVIFDIEDERGVGPICSARIEKEVTVVCGHTDHAAHLP